MKSHKKYFPLNLFRILFVLLVVFVFASNNTPGEKKSETTANDQDRAAPEQEKLMFENSLIGTWHATTLADPDLVGYTRYAFTFDNEPIETVMSFEFEFKSNSIFSSLAKFSSMDLEKYIPYIALRNSINSYQIYRTQAYGKLFYIDINKPTATSSDTKQTFKGIMQFTNENNYNEFKIQYKLGKRPKDFEDGHFFVFEKVNR